MKNSILFILITVSSGFLISCSTYQSSCPAYSSGPAIQQTSSGLLIASNNNSFNNIETIKRKILFSASLSLTVDKPDTANVYLEKIAEKYEGYVNEIGTYRTIIRVKSDRLDEAINEIAALGKIQSKNISGQDVTENYLDYQIKLENAEKARERYLELLKKAENVTATLKVEKELERLNGTIDLLKGKMNRIDHLAIFSTITITLKEKKKPGLLGYIGLGLYHSVKWLFVRN